MIKDFIAYINEGLFDRNQSEFNIRKTDNGVEQVYVPKTKEELYSYIDIDIEQAKKKGSYPNVDLNNIDVSEFGNDELKGLFGEDAYAINPDISDWNMKYIPNSFFYNNKQIKEFTISNSITFIGGHAFYNCRCLTKTNYTGDIAGWCGINFGGWGSNPTAYSHNLYINDVEVKDLLIPNGVTSIGKIVFAYCGRLTSVTIPNSVTSIGDYAFYKCSAITSVTIPNRVTSIGDGAFEGCSGMSSVTIGNYVTIIEGATFAFCSGLTSVTIPNSVTSIGDYAFSKCSRLTSIKIPNSVTNIGDYAFYGCDKLTSVTISKHCKIMSNSFPSDCKIIIK